MPSSAVELVSATRLAPGDFMQKAPLGQSLNRLSFDLRVKSRIFPDNSVGLSTIYNRVIDLEDDPTDVLVLLHDDVWIDDIFLADRVLEGLKTFDVIGVAGNRRRLPGQVIWSLDSKTGRGEGEPGNLSGAISQVRPFGVVTPFGDAGVACELLDGVFLAAKRSTLRQAGVRFDEQFDFHFYDLDFCRTARRAGLSLGTWPISITHRSWGAYNSPEWKAKCGLYLEKWGD